MFFGLILGLLGGACWLGYAHSIGQALPPGGLALTVASALGIAAVVLQMVRHPHGVRDWTQGGVVDLPLSTDGRLRWTDWAIAITRLGVLDASAGTLRLERRLFFGLIPAGTVARPVREFYRVEVQSEPRYSERRHRNSLVGAALSLLDSDPGDGDLIGYEYSVSLVDRKGDRLCVLDLTAGTSRAEEGFIVALRTSLEAALGRPGDAPAPPRGARTSPASEGDEAPPAGDQFEAWRRKKDGAA
jgi:hypothetical protein